MLTLPTSIPLLDAVNKSDILPDEQAAAFHQKMGGDGAQDS